jgi:hypothetical protein
VGRHGRRPVLLVTHSHAPRVGMPSSAPRVGLSGGTGPWGAVRQSAPKGTPARSALGTRDVGRRDRRSHAGGRSGTTQGTKKGPDPVTPGPTLRSGRCWTRTSDLYRVNVPGGAGPFGLNR